MTNPKNLIYWGAIATALTVFTLCSFSGKGFWTPDLGVVSLADKIYSSIAWTGTFALLLFLFTHIDGWKRCFVSMRAEIVKSSRFIYIYIAYAIIIIGSFAVVFAGDKFSKSFDFAGNLPNGYSYAVLSVWGNVKFMFLFVLGFTCHIIASEYSEGTLTTCLIRPIQRWEFLAGKILAIIIFILSSVLLSMGASIIYSGVEHPLGDIYVNSFLAVNTSVVIYNLMIFLGLILLVMFACASLAFFLSHLTKSVSGAILSTIGFYILVLIMDICFSDSDIHLFTGTDKFASTQTLNMAAAISYRWMPDALSYIYSCLSCIYVFCGLGCYLFIHRDIHGRG